MVQLSPAYSFIFSDQKVNCNLCMTTSTPRMIIRSNMFSPDLVINASDSLEASLNSLLTQNTDPTSLYFIDSKYLLFRLYDCAERALQTSFQPGNCPIIFDSWSCWNSTPPGQVMHEMCPSFDNLGFRPDRLAEKHCGENSTWWNHPGTNRWVGWWWVTEIIMNY